MLKLLLNTLNNVMLKELIDLFIYFLNIYLDLGLKTKKGNITNIFVN
jgi:hypothetical protein